MKKRIALLLVLVLCLSLAAGAMASPAGSAAKYVFFFIGDGMGAPQISATQYYLGTRENPEAAMPTPKALSFTGFKNVGIMTTYDATSFCPDSASTASSMAGGEKTLSGVINYDVAKERPFKLVSEYAKEAGKKVGVISSVSLDHATPAAFYAKAESRNLYYDIAVQGLTGTTLDLLAGGGFKRPTGDQKDQKDLYEIASENGFKLVNDNEGIRGLSAQDGRVLAIVPDLAGSHAMQYELDRQRKVSEGKDSLSLADITRAAISNLDNENGFFLMVEGGKIDWSCHANDATTSIYETIALSDAVEVAREFAALHPEETLIVVTGDHETGGMTIGFATTAYDTHFNYLQSQTLSYEDFDKAVGQMREDKATFEDALARIEAAYGLSQNPESKLALSAQELATLKAAYELSMLPSAQRVIGAQEALNYGGYEPLTVTCSHILNNKAGVAYTSYAHTGLQLPVYAQGKNAEGFIGSYDNTDIFFKLMDAMALTPGA